MEQESKTKEKAENLANYLLYNNPDIRSWFSTKDPKIKNLQNWPDIKDEELEPYGYWSVELGGAFGISRGGTGIEELRSVSSRVDDLSLELEYLKNEIIECKEGINNILEEIREKPIVKQIQLLEIGENLEVIKPIPIVIEEYDNEVIANFTEIEAFGIGSGEAEAIMNLKEEIRKIFFELESLNEDELGKLPIMWKKILLGVIKKIGDA